MIFGMIELARLSDLCRRLRASPGRLDKLALLADYLRALPPETVATAVAFLTGRAFPQSDPRVLGVRWLPAADDAPATGEPPAAAAPLTLADVAAAFNDIAQAGGAGSRRIARRAAARPGRPGVGGGARDAPADHGR